MQVICEEQIIQWSFCFTQVLVLKPWLTQR